MSKIDRHKRPRAYHAHYNRSNITTKNIIIHTCTHTDTSDKHHRAWTMTQEARQTTVWFWSVNINCMFTKKYVVWCSRHFSQKPFVFENYCCICSSCVRNAVLPVAAATRRICICGNRHNNNITACVDTQQSEGERHAENERERQTETDRQTDREELVDSWIFMSHHTLTITSGKITHSKVFYTI